MVPAPVYQVRTSSKGPEMTRLNVPDMSCGHCKAAIEKTIRRLDASAEIAFDMEARRVEFTAAADLAQVLEALKAEGYPASVAG